MPTTALTSLLEGYRYVTDRLMDRLDGITVEEYRWEPAPESWSVRRSGSGWAVERSETDPVPAPLTTIAWRTWHIASDCLAGYTTGFLGDWPLDLPEGGAWYGEPGPALAELRRSITVFADRMAALGEVDCWNLLGPAWGPFAESTWIDLFLHAFDEVVHHAAEIGLLRDLYARRA
jgi:hypothetical protein